MMNSKVLKCMMVLFVSIISFNTLMAQDEITDDEIKLYAEVMYKVDVMKEEGKTKYVEMIKADPLMQGGSRFNAIKKAYGDEEKLAELELTEEEMTAYENLLAENDKIAANIKTSFTTMVKEDLGAAVYNKIKKALKSDETVQTKYNDMYAAVEEAATAESEEESTEGEDVAGEDK